MNTPKRSDGWHAIEADHFLRPAADGGQYFSAVYTVVDTMVVGKALGVDALAALGAIDWLYWMLLGIIQGLT